ncbi:hypothetical protein D3C78_1066090 [compost metagenome]
MLLRLIGQLGGKILDLVVGRIVRHLQAGGVEQVLAVKGERAFGIKRHRVKLTVHRQAFFDRIEQIGVIIIVAEIIDRRQPALLTPDRRFVTADGHDVELAAIGGDIGGDTLAQDILFQHDPVDLVARFLLPGAGKLLHDDHVAIVDGGDVDFFRLRKPGQ